MPNPNENRPAVRNAWSLSLWITVLASILILSGLWGLCAWLKWGGEAHDPMDLIVYPAFAVVATLIIVPGVLLQIRKVRVLAARGVTVEGRVENISILGKLGHSMSPTTIVYTVNDREYRIRRDLPRGRFTVGASITILYDPQNPKRFSILF